MFNFQLLPHILEIRKDILVYGEGWENKYIKAPAIVKVKHTYLWKIELVTVWNRVKYFITKCRILIVNKCVLLTGFGLSLKHSAKVLYRKCFSTLSHFFLFKKRIRGWAETSFGLYSSSIVNPPKIPFIVGKLNMFAISSFLLLSKFYY